MAVDCEHSWYGRPARHHDAPADQHEIQGTQEVQQETPQETQQEDPVPDVPLDSPSEPASASMDAASSSVGASIYSSEPSEGLLNSQGLLVPEETPVVLPPRPASVYPSTPQSTLDEDDEDDYGADVEFEDAEENTPASSSSASGFVFPESLPLGVVAKKLKSVRVRASCRAPAKLALTSQPPLRKATHPIVPIGRWITQHLAARKSSIPPGSPDEEGTEYDPGRSYPSQPS